MWRKLNRIDALELEKARIQLQNAIQLISAAPRSYLDDSVARKDWLLWDTEHSSFESLSFGKDPRVKLKLDIEQFVLSIIGDDDHIEHLVLSGITYPMAFGWLKVKLESFSLDADLYHDVTNYEIEQIFGLDDELNVTKQQVFSDILTYYANAFDLFMKLNEGLELHGVISINPATMNMVLNLKKKTAIFDIGFSLGNRQIKAPFYFMQMHDEPEDSLQKRSDFVGNWNEKDWHGLIISANEFLNTKTEVEESLVSDFFNKNYWRLANR